MYRFFRVFILGLSVLQEGTSFAQSIDSVNHKTDFAFKASGSLNTEFETTIRPALTFSGKRLMHDVEFVTLSFSKDDVFGMVEQSTRTKIQYQLAYRLVNHQKLKPYIGLSVLLSGTQIHATPLKKGAIEKERVLYWSVISGISFPMRILLTDNYFLDTNLILNLNLLYGGERKTTYSAPTKSIPQYSWSDSIRPFDKDRINLKLGIGRYLRK